MWTGRPVHQPSGARPAPRLPSATRRLPDDAQETPVHPEMYLRIYRQQMVDLERRLERQHSAEERGPVRPHRGHAHRVIHLSLHRRGAHSS